MGKYTVVQPVSYLHDGAAVHQTASEVGTVIDVDDAQAAPLVEAGALEPHGLIGGIKRTVRELGGDFLPGPIIKQPFSEAHADEDDQATGRRPRRKSDDGQSA